MLFAGIPGGFAWMETGPNPSRYSSALLYDPWALVRLEESAKRFYFWLGADAETIC